MECVCLIMIMAQEICMQLNKLMTVMVVSSALALSGCSAMGTAIKKEKSGSKNPDERNNLAGTFK